LELCGLQTENVAKAKRKDLVYGDVWTWVALDADTKLAISYLVAVGIPVTQ
jgi:hypothetical protein